MTPTSLPGTANAGIALTGTAAGAAGSSLPGIKRLLVANRGEIAVRILARPVELGLATVAVHPPDDGACAHLALADDGGCCPRPGVAGYLDVAAVIDAALASGADSIHPGYGFLAESAELARALRRGRAPLRRAPARCSSTCSATRPAARRAAAGAGRARCWPAPTARPPSSRRAPCCAEHGGGHAQGGGRRRRPGHAGGPLRPAELEPACARCVSEAASAFGDGAGLRRAAAAVGPATSRSRSSATARAPWPPRRAGLQHPAPPPEAGRDRPRSRPVAGAAAPDHGGGRGLARPPLRLARSSLGYDRSSWSTAEFRGLPGTDVSRSSRPTPPAGRAHGHRGGHRARPGELQLRLAAGATLADLGLAGHGDGARPGRWAIQARVNAETMRPTARTCPATGTLTAFEPPAGPGVRVDTAGYPGYTVSPALRLAAGQGDRDRRAARLTRRRASRTGRCASRRIEGSTPTSPCSARRGPPLRCARPPPASWRPPGRPARRRGPPPPPARRRAAAGARAPTAMAPVPAGRRSAGARLDSDDPLAVLAFGQRRSTPGPGAGGPGGGGAARRSRGHARRARAAAGHRGRGRGGGRRRCAAGPAAGRHRGDEDGARGAGRRAAGLVRAVRRRRRRHRVRPARPCCVLADVGRRGRRRARRRPRSTSTTIRPDLAEVLERHADRTLDEARPDAVARRRATGSARPGRTSPTSSTPARSSSTAPLAVAAQRRRRSLEDLIAQEPGRRPGHRRRPRQRRPVRRPDRPVRRHGLRLHGASPAPRASATTARPTGCSTSPSRAGCRWSCSPRAAAGGPATPTAATVGLDAPSSRFATLSGLVPMVAIVSGRCFAGNASLLGCCDVIIATADANIGMGGPAMIEGGGLGVFRPEEIGPMRVQVAERRGRHRRRRRGRGRARRPSGTSRYFQGPAGRLGGRTTSGHCATSCPENRLRVYDVRQVIDTLADVGSVLELRPGFGVGMITALARIEGRPVGRHRQQPDAPGRGHRLRRRRQGARVHAAVRRLRPARSCSCATRRGSWSAPRSRRRPSCATPAACSWSAPT